jgi:hypothetical protein
MPNRDSDAFRARCSHPQWMIVLRARRVSERLIAAIWANERGERGMSLRIRNSSTPSNLSPESDRDCRWSIADDTWKRSPYRGLDGNVLPLLGPCYDGGPNASTPFSPSPLGPEYQARWQLNSVICSRATIAG